MRMTNAQIAELIGYAAAILGIFSFLPQAYDIWKTKNTKSISLLTFSLIVVIALLWVAYGLLLSAAPILLVNVVIFFVASYIVTMKLKYK